MNIHNYTIQKNPGDVALDHFNKFAGDEIAINWLEWVDSIKNLQNWRTQSNDRYLTVNIDTDLSTEHELFDSLLIADKIAINIESYVDGRIFSLARVIRDHLGFSGELQASGDYLPDQVRFLQRCGIDSFADTVVVDQTVKFFSEFYQPATRVVNKEVYIRDARHRENSR